MTKQFKVIAPSKRAPEPRKAALAVKRSKLQPQNRSVEHVKYGVGNLLHVRPLDGGMFAAVVNFSGVDRTIRLAPAYFITPIPEIMALAPHLSPPPAPKKKAKGSAVPDEGEEELEPESAEVSEDDGASEPTWL